MPGLYIHQIVSLELGENTQNNSSLIQANSTLEYFNELPPPEAVDNSLKYLSAEIDIGLEFN